MTFTPRLLAARTAPSTSAFGAWSPPIASTAMVSMLGRGYSCDHFDDFAAFVLAALRANAVRQLRLVAVGALRKTGCLQRIVRAARARAPLGVSTFGIRHFSTSTNFVQLLPFARASQYSEFQITERAPAIVATSGLQSQAVSFRFLPQTGADPFTGLAAHPLHRQRQQHLFPEDVLQFQPPSS